MKTNKKTEIVVACVAMMLIIGVTFLPALFNGFVNWDDQGYITDNDDIQEGFIPGIKNIFSKSYLGVYCPIVMSSFLIEYGIFGEDAVFFHLTNYFLHLMNAVLILYLFYLLSGDILVALLTSLLFGVHPLNVETVAWISERKGLFCALFSTLSMISYVKYTKKGALLPYVLAFLFFISANLSKQTAVTIPIIFILFDFLRRRKVSSIFVLEKVPFFVFAFIFGIVALKTNKVVDIAALVGGHNRLVYLLKGPLFYLDKIIWPFDLSCLYGYGGARGSIMIYVVFYVALITVAIYSLKFTRKVVFALLFFFFFFAILPVLQIVPVGYTFASDRYVYIASVGILYAFSFFIIKLARETYYLKRSLTIIIVGLLTVLVLSYSFLSWHRCGVWADSVSLFSDAIEKSPSNPIILCNLAKAKLEKGETEEAMTLYNRSIKCAPEYANAYNALGNIYRMAGRDDLSIEYYKKSINADPSRTPAYNNLGMIYSQRGDRQKAIKYFTRAILIDPESEILYINLGRVFHDKGEYDKASHFYGLGLDLIDPHSSEYTDVVEYMKSSSVVGAGRENE